MLDFVSFLRSYLRARWLFPILAAAVLVFGAVGYCIATPKDFWANLLIELAGTLLSILIGLLVVDKFLDYRRRREWERIRDVTFRDLGTHLCELATHLFIHLGGPYVEAIFAGHGQLPNEATLSAFADVLDGLEKVPERWADDYKSPDDVVAQDFFNAVKWDLEQIQRVLTPRILEAPMDQRFKEVVIEFDAARREFQHAIIAHREVVVGGTFPAAITLIGAAKRLYGDMIRQLRKQ